VHNVSQWLNLMALSAVFHCMIELLLLLQEDTKPSDVVSFIEKHNTPLVGQYGRQTKDKVYKDRRPLVLFFYTVDWTFEHREGWFCVELVQTIIIILIVNFPKISH